MFSCNVNIKYGIVGAGNAGILHAYCVSLLPNVNLALICDIEPDRLEFAKKMFPNVETTSDLDDLLSMDAVSICTPHNLHYNQAEYFLSNEVSVLVEKPLVHHPEELALLNFNHSAKYGAVLQRRHNSEFMALKKSVKDGCFGDLLIVRAKNSCSKDETYYQSWKGKKEIAGGGVLINQAIHVVDQMINIFGLPKSIVKAKSSRRRDYIDVEDIFSAIVKYDGFPAEIYADSSSGIPWQSELQVVGTRGEVVIDSGQVKKWSINAPLPDKEREECIPPDIRPFYFGPHHLTVIRNFCNAVISGNDKFIKAEDSLNSLRLIFDLYKSASDLSEKFY